MIVGIDLGTTNSAIAVWRDGQSQLIRNSLGSYLTPSAVSVDDDGRVLVGMAARERQVTHPHVTVTAFKRWMGTSRVTHLGGSHQYRPEELSALVLRSLKADAEAFLGEPVTEAVITVPAFFNDHQRAGATAPDTSGAQGASPGHGGEPRGAGTARALLRAFLGRSTRVHRQAVE